MFSDAPTEEGHQKIAAKCKRYGIRCIRIPQYIHEEPYYLPLNLPQIYGNHTIPSNVRHVHCVQYSLDTLGFDHDGIVVLIDSDMFLVRPLNISEYMKDSDITSFMKGSINEQGGTIGYLCPALTFLNMQTLPDKRSLNFNCGLVNGCSGDSGGFTHYYLQEHPHLRLRCFGSLYSGQMFCSDRFYPNSHQNAQAPVEQKKAYWESQGFNKKEIKFLLKNPDTIQYFMEGKDAWFLHYRGGTNYENLPSSYHAQKKSLVAQYLQDIMGLRSIFFE